MGCKPIKQLTFDRDKYENASKFMNVWSNCHSIVSGLTKGDERGDVDRVTSGYIYSDERL